MPRPSLPPPSSWCLAALVVLAACASDPEPKPTEPDPASEPSPPSSSETIKVDEPAPSADPLRRAVDHPDRPTDDRARDPDRRPYEVMTFFGVEPGMKVADLMCGRGYYGELLGRAVAPEGTAYCQNNRFVIDRFADEPLRERLARPGLESVERVDAELTELPFAEGSLDVVQMVLFYHDTYWLGVDRAAMNQAIFRALKPGGVYGVIDHRAEAGSGERDVKTLHRVDERLVKEEILAAGFVLEEESPLLTHPEDERTTNVFEEAIRGRTDRFVLRFRKPE